VSNVFPVSTQKIELDCISNTALSFVKWSVGRTCCLFTINKYSMKKVSDYMELSENVLWSMIDYIGGVASSYDAFVWDKVKRHFRTDNGSVINIGSYALVMTNDTITGSASYMGYSIPIFQFSLIKPSWTPTIKRDLYGKWLVYLRDTADWSSLRDCFRFVGIYMPYLTRYDHCIDKIHTGRKNKARFKSTFNASIRRPYVVDWQTTYVLYWSRRSSHFIRIYDKTLDLVDSWHSRLYPQYDWKHIIRYELQVTSKWIDPETKKISFDQIRQLAYENYIVPPDTTPHHKSNRIRWLHTHLRDVRRVATQQELYHFVEILSKNIVLAQKQIEDYEIKYYYKKNSDGSSSLPPSVDYWTVDIPDPPVSHFSTCLRQFWETCGG